MVASLKSPLKRLKREKSVRHCYDTECFTKNCILLVLFQSRLRFVVHLWSKSPEKKQKNNSVLTTKPWEVVVVELPSSYQENQYIFVVQDFSRPLPDENIVQVLRDDVFILVGWVIYPNSCRDCGNNLYIRRDVGS